MGTQGVQAGVKGGGRFSAFEPSSLRHDSVRGVELDLPMEQLHVAAFACLAET